MNNSEQAQLQQLILYRYKRKRYLKLYPENIHLWQLENIFTKQKVWAKIQSGSQYADKVMLYEASYLHTMQGHLGFPMEIWGGRQKKNTILVTQQLGPDLAYLLDRIPQKRFSLKTVCMIGIQLLKLIEDYHRSKLIHRNICPEALHIGKKQKNHIIYLSDLQSTRKYIDEDTGIHISENKKRQSDLKISIFTTVNQLKTRTSRRDDIETAILLLIYLLKGSLPWESTISQNSPQQFKVETLISNYKKDIILFQGIPIQFKQMVLRARSMQFTQEPAYIWYQSKLKLIMYRNNWHRDWIFDWVNTKQVNQNFRIDRSLPTLCLQNQDELLEKYYYPFEKDVDIEEIFDKPKQQIKKSINSAKTIDTQKNIPQKPNKSSECETM